METSKAERLNEAVATLNDLIALTQGLELHETTQFLAMAKLNLLIDLHGVTEEEFRTLCAAIEGEVGSGGKRSARGRVLTARGRRSEAPDGETPRKTWRAPDGLAALQASRGKQ